jgi:hypothetical protein
MSQNSSPKKNFITSSAEYDRLYQLYYEAWDRIQSGGTGAGYSGIHYEVFDVIGKYGRFANSRESAVSELKKLLREYETEYLGAEGLSDDSLPYKSPKSQTLKVFLANQSENSQGNPRQRDICPRRKPSGSLR